VVKPEGKKLLWRN